MAPTSPIATTFLILSDTHNFEFTAGTSQPFHLPTPKTDVLLHCGDLTQVGGISSFKQALQTLSLIPAELKLVIPGNHDLELDKTFCLSSQHDEEGVPVDAKDHDLAVEIMTGALAKEAGVTFLNEGTYAFTLKNGAKFSIYVSPYTPTFNNWAFAYSPNEDRFNAPNQVANDGITSIATNPIPDNVDIIMTHGPPHGILDYCPQGSVGCPNLLEAVRRVKPLMHCFGHIHEGYGVEVVDWKKGVAAPRKNEAVHRFFEDEGSENENPYPGVFRWEEGKGKTLAVNASVMTGEGRLENKPWLVRINLPRA